MGWSFRASSTDLEQVFLAKGFLKDEQSWACRPLNLRTCRSGDDFYPVRRIALGDPQAQRLPIRGTQRPIRIS